MDKFLHKKGNDFDGSVQENVEAEKFSSDADEPVKIGANTIEQDSHIPSLRQEAKSMSTKEGNQDRIIRPRTEGSLNMPSGAYLFSRKLERMMLISILLATSCRTRNLKFPVRRMISMTLKMAKAERLERRETVMIMRAPRRTTVQTGF